LIEAATGKTSAWRILRGNKMMTFGEGKLQSRPRGLWKSGALTTKSLFVSLNSDLANSCSMAFGCVRKTA
jgi:hypothetical protein